MIFYMLQPKYFNFMYSLRAAYKYFFSYVCLRDATRNDRKIGRRVCVAGRATLCDQSIS